MTLFLKQSTSIDIRVGPFVDATDAVTPEIGITLAGADQAEVLKANGAATAAMAGTFAAVTGADGWYDYTVATGDVDTVGEVVFVVQDSSVALPVFVRGYVVEEAVYDAMYGATAAGPLQATTAGRTLDISATGESALDFDATIGTLDAAQFGADFLTSAKIADNAFLAVNFAAASLNGKGNWNIGKTGYSLAATGLDAIISTATGMVEIAKAIWDRVLTGGTHNIADSAGRRLRDLQEFGTYEGGAVWIDTVNGTAGTTNFESGTYINPVDNIADANTIAASVGLVRFQVAPGSSITFPGAQTNEVWEGRDWTLALANRDITGSFILGAIVTGIGTATTVYELEECDIGVTTLDNDGHFERCSLTGTFTIGQAGTFTFHQCFTEATTAITIDFAAVGTTAVHLLDFHGQINFKNMAAGDTVHITGAGTITTETCTAGTIDHDGFFEYTDAGGNVTEQQSDIKVAVDAIIAKKNVAMDDIGFVMVLTTDHVSPAPGLSPVATKSIDGGTTFTATTGTVTEIANGAYSFDASAADMNGTIILFKFSVATADDTFVLIRTSG